MNFYKYEVLNLIRLGNGGDMGGEERCKGERSNKDDNQTSV